MAHGLLGRKRTKKECRNISLGLKGHTVSQKTKEKLRKCNLGKKLSKTHIEAIRLSQIGHKYKTVSGEKHGNWVPGAKYVPKRYFTSLQDGAKRRGLKFSITRKYIDYLFEKQNKKCYYSQLDLKFGTAKNKKGERAIVQTASLDRIDSLKGYQKGNLIWIHKRINRMKGSLSEKEFLYFCKMVSKNDK